MGFATPSSAQFLMKRTCRSSTRRTQCGTHIAGSARVTTSGCIERLISPAFSLQWRARARNCRRFGFSSGVACGETSSEEAEDGEYHARTHQSRTCANYVRFGLEPPPKHGIAHARSATRMSAPRHAHTGVARTRFSCVCASRLRWRAHGRNTAATRRVGFRRRVRRDLLRRGRSGSIWRSPPFPFP